MESLSSVTTMVRIARDFAAAMETVGRNKSRCKKLARRVQIIADLLQESDAVTASTKMDAATQSLLGGLEEALSASLRLVRSCQDSSYPRNLIAGGRMAEQFNQVELEIDRCLLDLGLANRLIIAHVEKQLHLNLAASNDTADSQPVRAKLQSNLHHVHFKDTGVNKYDSACYIKDAMKDAYKDEKKGKMPDPVSKGGGEWEERDKIMATGNVAAIGVPLDMVTAGMPELVPPSSYGYGYWPYDHARCTGGCCHCNTVGPSDAAAANIYNYYSQYPDMFSDENPNAYCSIM